MCSANLEPDAKVFAGRFRTALISLSAVLSHPIDQGNIVVVAPERPTFGVWERLDSWTPSADTMTS